MRFLHPVLVLGGLTVLPAFAFSQHSDDPWKKAAEFGKKRAALKNEPKEWLKLAAWCEKAALPVEAEHCFANALKLDPENAEARKKLGYLKKADAWLTRAEQIAAKPEKGSVLFGLEWVKQDKLAERLKKEQAEVGWTFERKIQGPHWTIYTDAPEEIGRKILAVAEAVYDAFVADVAGMLPMAPKPLRAYVFKDRERFMKEANLPTAWAEGYYDGGRCACFCYYDPTNARNPTHWFVHEATHQLIGELVVNCSGLNAWLSEGYACHYGTSKFEDGALQLGTIDPDTYPAWFRKQYPPSKLWPLAEFDSKIAPKFGELRDPNPFYLQSWLLVRFLAERRRDAFRAFFFEAAKGRADCAAFEKSVGTFQSLQEEFLKFAEEVRGK